MGERSQGGQKRIDVGALEVGARYRVDWKHAQLRRSFRFVGTLLSVEPEPGHADDAETAYVLKFEVKPRFGKPAVETVHQATLMEIVPA